MVYAKIGHKYKNYYTSIMIINITEQCVHELFRILSLKYLFIYPTLLSKDNQIPLIQLITFPKYSHQQNSNLKSIIAATAQWKRSLKGSSIDPGAVQTGHNLLLPRFCGCINAKCSECLCNIQKRSKLKIQIFCTSRKPIHADGLFQHILFQHILF